MRLTNARLGALIEQLEGFAPDAVLFIERGGRPLGEALAQRYHVPAIGIDVAYPLSRLSHRTIRWMAFPVKELAYRLTSPRLISETDDLSHIDTAANLLIVDDSASSGKTLGVVRKELASMGHLGQNRVAVGRLGRRAVPWVDAALSRP